MIALLLSPRLALFVLFFSLSTSALAASIFDDKDVQAQCHSQYEQPFPVFDEDDFPWEQTPQQMSDLFDAYLGWGKRFEYRGYVENGRFLVPLVGDNKTGQNPRLLVEFPQRIVEGVRAHMHRAFAAGYAHYPFFPDMGHGHFYIPEEDYNDPDFRKLSAEQSWRFVLNHPKLKILYHTSEQLVYVDKDGKVIPSMRFLRDHRNVVGQFDSDYRIYTAQAPHSEGSSTSPTMPGYQGWGAIYMTAAPNGCFPFFYPGQNLRLDIGIVGASYIPNDEVIPAFER